MARGRKTRPTEAELVILNALWELGPSTVRQVHETLPGSAGRRYTTTLKIMQIMVEKGLVTRDVRKKSHIYRPRVSREDTQGWLVGDLARRAFGGSAASLVLRALTEQPASPDELRRIREVLDELESGKGRRGEKP